MIANSVRIYTYDTVNYYNYDPHGNVVSIGGKTYTYDAFGNQTNDNTDGTNPFRYSGEYFDSETGYIYLRARYYDPSIGRFITEDPARDGLNWYVYCSNNPIMFIDPSGYITEEERQMYENGEMSPGAYSYLMYCTYQYYLTDEDVVKRAYRYLANQFRETGYATTGIKQWDNIINGMGSKPSNGVVTEWEHYYRNNLNLEFSYDELMKLNQRLPEDMRWETVAAKYHQNHKVNNKANIKYVSGCGHFEVVYNDNKEIQNRDNNTDDMGTYNYSASNKASGWYGHYIYDMLPYDDYGNVPENERRIP